LNETWGDSKFDTTWKSPGEVIRRLVEIVSKGGNYLLNVGPDGEGVIPGASVRILQKVGEWVEKNGESIYGTTASPFPEIPWGRCTVKENVLYFHVFEWPGRSGLVIDGLHNKIKNAALLVEPDRNLPITQEGTTARITLPENPPDEINTVIAVEIEGKPVVDPPVVHEDGSGALTLGCVEGVTEGKAVKRYNRKGDFHISKWTGPEDKVVWNVNTKKSGIYLVEITYAANREWADKKYEMSAGPERLTADVQHTGDWYEYKTIEIGRITLQAGYQTVIVKPLSSADTYLMYFKSIRLMPL
jgi:alpha-L-fucosidase